MLAKSYQIAISAVLLLCSSLTQAAEEETGPYTFEGMYRLDYWTGITGPLKKQVDNVGLLDLRFTVDGEKSWKWKGGRLFVQAQGTHGSHPSNVQVTVQGIDNAEVKRVFTMKMSPSEMETSSLCINQVASSPSLRGSTFPVQTHTDYR